jgi:outer membrane lipoprotein-sorting protein
LFSVLIGIAAPAQDLTLDQILKKNEDAIGGAEAISKVQTLRMAARITMGDGQLIMTTTTSIKRPNLIRFDTSTMGQSVVSAYDGTTGWMIDPLAGSSAPRKLDEATVSKFTGTSLEGSIGALIGLLSGIKAAGNTVELLGKEDVKGSPAYKLRVTFKVGTTSTYFVDATSFLLVKIISRMAIMGQDVESEGYPSHYKKVGDILFAHSVESISSGGSTGSTTYDKIEINVPMEDRIFKVPGTEADPAIRKKILDTCRDPSLIEVKNNSGHPFSGRMGVQNSYVGLRPFAGDRIT